MVEIFGKKSIVKEILRRLGIGHAKQYDSIIFGNGFNVRVEGIIKREVKEEYKFLFSFSEFLDVLISGNNDNTYIEIANKIISKSGRESLSQIYADINNIYSKNPKELFTYFETEFSYFVNEIARKRTNNLALAVCLVMNYLANENYHKFFRKIVDDKKALKDFNNLKRKIDNTFDNICFYYNLYDCLQNQFISHNPQLQEIRLNEYKNFKINYLTDSAITMTTNYGCEIEEYWENTEYLHGKYESHRIILNELDEVIRALTIKENNQYNFLFAPTALKKHYLTDNRYNDAFFKDNTRTYGHMLVYGMSFAKMAIAEELSTVMPNKRLFDTYIDNHIIVRISELIDSGQIEDVDIVAYSELDFENINSLLESYKNNNQKNVYVQYKNKKINVVKYEAFE